MSGSWGWLRTADTGAGETYFACGNEHHAVAFFRAESLGHRHIGLEISEDRLIHTLKSLKAVGIRAAISRTGFTVSIA